MTSVDVLDCEVRRSFGRGLKGALKKHQDDVIMASVRSIVVGVIPIRGKWL